MQNFFLLFYLIIISLYDIKYLKIEDSFLTGLFITTSGVVIADNNLFIRNFFVAVLFFLVFFLIYSFTDGLGFGDVKLISLIAYSSGFWNTCIISIVACIVGLIFFLIRFIQKKYILKIPFAPFLTAGTLIAFIKEVM